jgi:hypothetical protein
MKDLISLCFVSIFAIVGFVLILIGVTSYELGGLLPFLLGCGSVIISFRIMP